MRYWLAALGLATSVVLSALPRDASAQLLPGLLNPVVTTVNTVVCSLENPESAAKLDAALQSWTRSGAPGRQRVIVSSTAGLLGTVKNLLLALGGTVLGELTSIDALVADANAADLTALACDPDVASISLDAVVRLSSDSAASTYTVRATLGLLPDSPNGAGVRLAVIDSGIANSADFDNRLVASYDFTNGGKQQVAPSDGYGHGTHVAGLIASNGSLASGALYQGLAPAASLIAMKVLDATGAGRTSDVIRAVEFATVKRSSLGVQLINLSLGHPIYEPAARDPLVREVEGAARAGIIVVVAAGNRGVDPNTGQVAYGGVTSPGNAPSAITVGALMTRDTITRSDDTVAPYSSRGPTWYDGFSKPDLVAPGHSMISDAAVGSTLYTQYPSAIVSDNYLRLSGTSMATGVVSGAVALVLQANQVAHPGAPQLTPNAVKAILQYSALPMHDESGASYDAITQGTGGLNVKGAIELARAIDTSRPTASYWLTTSVVPMTTIGSENWDWSQHIVWGNGEVWGGVLDNQEGAWSPATRWGSQVSWSSHIVWGSDTVWGRGTSWASHIVWGSNLVGTSVDGEHIVWGSADQPESTVWGNLADTTDGSASP